MDNFDMNQTTPNKFVFKKEREFGDIISDTFSFFTQNYKSILQVLLKFVGPFVLLSIIGSTYYQYKTGDLFNDITLLGSDPDIFTNAIFENIWALLFLLIVSIATYIVLYGTVLHIIKSYISNNGEILEQEISQGIKKDFWKLLGYFILTGILSLIGFILCFLPGVYLVIVFTPGVALLVMEDESVTETFTKCFTLIKDNWWITFATVLVFGILISILGYVFQLPTLIYTMVESFTAIEKSSDPSAIADIYQNWVYLLFAAIGSLGQLFLNIFTVIMAALVYFNLSEKHNFTGTYEQIDQIGNDA